MTTLKQIKRKIFKQRLLVTLKIIMMCVAVIALIFEVYFGLSKLYWEMYGCVVIIFITAWVANFGLLNIKIK